MAKKNPQLRQRLKREHHLAHREERETKEREHFTQAPTGRQARHQANAAVNTEYGPVTRGIRQELANSAAQQKKGTEWYNQLGSELAGAAQQEEAGAAALGSTLTQQLAQANATNAATLAKQEAANAQFAQTTGMQGATGQAAAAGNAQSALTGVALNAPIEAGARDQAAYTRRLGLVQKEQGHEYGQGQIGVRKKLRQDLVAAQKQKGQAFVGRLAEERESARKQELDAKAFELEGQQTALQAQQEREKLAQDEKQNKRQAQTTRRGQNTSAASSAASTAASVEGNEVSRENANTSKRQARVAEEKAQREAQKERYEKSHPNAPSTLTPSEKHEEKAQRENAATLIQEYLTTLKPNQKPAWNKLAALLHVEGIEARVAREIVNRAKARYGNKGVSADPNEASLGR